MASNKKTFQQILKETEENRDEILNKEGEIVGEVFRTQLKYIRNKKGEKGLDDFAEQAKKLGRELDLREIKPQQWYPVGLRPYGWLVMLKAFNWGKKELIDSGYQAPKTSFIMKVLARYFLSLEATIKKSPHYWKKHYTIGSLEVVKVDAKKKEFILKVKDFQVSPLFCIFYTGYFAKVLELGGAKDAKIKETKCMFKEDDHHEFLFTWEN